VKSLEKRLAVGLSAAVAVLLLIAAAAGWNAVRFDRTFTWVDHTHQVLTELEQVQVGVMAMQASARAFVFSGQSDLVTAIEADHLRVRDSMQAARRLTVDNPAQQGRLSRLDPLIHEAVGAFEGLIATRRARGPEAALAGPALLDAQRTVEQVRSVVRELEAEEHRLLRRRVDETQRAARATIETAAVGELIALTFLIASALRVRRDVRERVRAQEALQQSQRMFERLFDNAPDAIVQVNQQGRIVRTNRRVEALFGWARTELTGQRLDLLMPERFRTRHGAHLDTYFANPRTRPMGAGLELAGARKDGSEFPVDILLSPIETDDGMQALAVIRDVTDQRRNDETIRNLNRDLQLQNLRLEAANKELESFSYSVSHDLRAPLRHIDGFASLLANHARERLDDKGRRFVTVISDSARRMGRLIDDLLTFSRMGRAQLVPGAIDHGLLVAGVIRESGFDRDPKIAWSIAPLPVVHADEAMLRQVWFNLIDNAVKYSSHTAAPRIEIGATTDPAAPGEQVFFIRDNGVGFDMKYAPKLFGVFQRLHSEAEFEGTGIGLANVRRIVTRHGGRTWAESELGKGATFYFSLPDGAPRPAG
jgi:PAS domain S-box-containing protein